MRASWLDGGDGLDAAALHAQGLLYARLSQATFRQELDRLKRERGYVQEDEIALGPSTPGLETIGAKFIEEHLHDDDEVRFILDGEGIFDVRSREDRYMRIFVEKDDLIVVPAQRYHRFQLTESKTIRAVRLFKDDRGWVPRYRTAGRSSPGA